MKTFSHNKSFLIVILMIAGFLITSSTSVAMPLHMDDCTVKTACENCCLISVPELSGLQCEYSLTDFLDITSANLPDPEPLPFDHPPQ